MSASILRPRAALSTTSSLFACSRPSPRIPAHAPSPTRTLFNLSPTALLAGTNPPTLRTLTHTRILPYSHTTIFAAISSIDTYATFLPFTLSSSILSRDARNALPTRALLRVGYPQLNLSESFESLVSCNPSAGTIEARSVDPRSVDSPSSTSTSTSTSTAECTSIFDTLKTRWAISPVESEDKVGHPGAKNQTEVRLDIEVKFKNAVYDQMFAQVEGKVASALVGAFEKRAKEIEEADRQAKVKFS